MKYKNSQAREAPPDTAGGVSPAGPSPAGPTDEALIREFQSSGARECLALLFDRYRQPLYSRACAICRNPTLAEDCVQETFRRVIENIGRFEENRPNSFWAWLVTISRRVFLDEARRARYERPESLPRGAVRCAPLQESQAILAELNGELARLPPEYRTCYLLFQVAGCSYKEIARSTGFTYAQVKTRIQTARRHLARRFRALPA